MVTARPSIRPLLNAHNSFPALPCSFFRFFISYLVQAHSFCLNLEEFPLNLEICIEYLSHGRLKIDLRPNFHTWDNRRYRVRGYTLAVNSSQTTNYVVTHVNGVLPALETYRGNLTRICTAEVLNCRAIRGETVQLLTLLMARLVVLAPELTNRNW